MPLFDDSDLEKTLLNALVFVCGKLAKGKPEIMIHENHKGLSIKVGTTKYIFFGDDKVVISEKSTKGFANTMKTEDI